jgi:hypothetical protein
LRLHAALNTRPASQHATGSGDDRRDYDGRQTYALERRTVWGNVFSTSTLNGAGMDAVWGSPWAPSEGHVDMPLSSLSASHVALKVCDADFGKKDDDLGEVAIDVDALLAMNGAPATLQLWRKQGLMGGGGYKPQKGRDGAPSVVVVSAVPSAEEEGCAVADAEFRQGVRRVCIRVHAAQHLRSADTVGANDVYCQLYELPPGAPPAHGAPLPAAPALATLPRAQALVVPFSFQLPVHLPSSLEGVPGVDYGFVRCSIYAHIHIAWKLDPSCRAFISIIQPVPASLPRLLAPLGAAGERPVFGLRCCGKCCCECCVACCGPACCEDRSTPLGVVALQASLPRSGFAPGEEAELSLRISNGTPSACILRVEFVRVYMCAALGGATRRPFACHTALEFPLAPGLRDATFAPLRILVPLLSPDFHGPPPGLYAPGGATGPKGGLFTFRPRVDPLRWRTVMRVTVDVPGTPFDLVHDLPIFIAALPLPRGVPMAPPGAQAMHASAPLGVPPPPMPLTPLPPPGTPTGADDPASDAAACVHTFAELPAVADDVASSSSASVRTAQCTPVDARDAQEDTNCDAASLSYAPQYFVATPAQPRLVLSPYAPAQPPIDVSACPPGAVALCPYTRQPFVVPHPAFVPAPQ